MKLINLGIKLLSTLIYSILCLILSSFHNPTSLLCEAFLYLHEHGCISLVKLSKHAKQNLS